MRQVMLTILKTQLSLVITDYIETMLIRPSFSDVDP